MILKKVATQTASAETERNDILQDYYICCLSRELSLLIRREVLTGHAKFGVSDDGKEVYQVALAKTIQPGDWRADYYRGHTLLLALGLATPEDFLAQLYADNENDPFSGGRQMVGHFATPLVDDKGEWLDQRKGFNLSSDVSTTAGQMARGFGLAFASRVFREAEQLDLPKFSEDGNEICHCSIGDASTSEGAFWETMNAAAVIQCPLAVTVVDDGYGISVEKSYQTVKSSISEALAGFKAEQGKEGIDIYLLKGWDYPALCEGYEKGVERMRRTHRPALFHVDELTQPQGHSTSGSHERYKSAERLAWEAEYDCNRQFRLWLLATGLAEEQDLQEIEAQAKQNIKEARRNAWQRFSQPLGERQRELSGIVDRLANEKEPAVAAFRKELQHSKTATQSELLAMARRLRFALREQPLPDLDQYIERERHVLEERFAQHLTSPTPKAAVRVPAVPAVYSEESPMLNGFEVINRFFDGVFQRMPEFYAFGEDLGKIGGVNQGFAGLQAKYGEHRLFDTGIREWTIMGQAIGLAMRGLRPLAEIQYLDYLIYGYSPLSDDLATLRWRSNGQQAAPAIIRTRGHRLEGIWHSGSPMGVLLGGLRGIHLCVPRNMVQAVGMYNTLLQSDDPGIVIESLNGYRLKERLPDNLDTFTVPLGVPEVVREGTDLTLVTYGSCVRIAEAACDTLSAAGVEVELIDVQTLLPFDLEHRIAASLAKTNRLLVVDEDVPGGGAAYIMQHILEEQMGFFRLDAQPATLTAKAYRPPYGDDGNYINKPNKEDIVEKVWDLVLE